MSFLYFVSFGATTTGIIIFILSLILSVIPKKQTLAPRKCSNYAVLIPARYESDVIEDLLISIKNQISFDDVYIIVENIKDKTCTLADKYNANIILRKNLNNKTKGYALDEAIKEILSKKRYDLYFILDADNIIEDNYFNELIKNFEEGYDIGTSYRNIKNPNNCIASCSILTFTMINDLMNKKKVKKHKSIIISGTGYFINGKLIDEWQGFPFHTLTEDYELSLYINDKNINCTYNEWAVFYDEQPEDMKTSILQRTRWVKGFLDSRKNKSNSIDIEKIAGITPFIFMIIGAITFFITNIIGIIINPSNAINYIHFNIYLSLVIYFVLSLFTLLLLLLDKNKLNLTNKLKLQSILYNPIFLVTYIICLLKCNKKIKWDTIDHKKKLS